MAQHGFEVISCDGKAPGCFDLKGDQLLAAVEKGSVVRQVLLPEPVSRALLAQRGDAGANDPVFASGKGGGRLTERAVLGIVKRAAARAGLEAPVSPHWLRDAHASHAIDRGATLPEVQATLGHGNIATTSGYLHARPESSSGLKLGANRRTNYNMLSLSWEFLKPGRAQ
jgi:site-specific recombinase XerC